MDALCEHIRSPAGLIGFNLLQVLVATLLVNHYIACAWYGVAHFGNAPRAWTDADELKGFNAGGLYLVALHWALTQFSPSTQNIGPQSVNERLFAAIHVVVALGLVSICLSTITAYTNEIRQVAAKRHQQDMQLRKFFSSRKVSKRVGIRIQTYLKGATTQQKRLVHEAEIPVLKQLPQSLRIRLRGELYMPCLKGSQLFVNMYLVDPGFLLNVCHSCFKEKFVPQRFDIFQDNTRTDCAIFLHTGTATYSQSAEIIDSVSPNRLSLNQSARVSALQPSVRTKLKSTRALNQSESVEGEVWISEMALWSNWTHCGGLVSKSACELLEIDATEFCSVALECKSNIASVLAKVSILAVQHQNLIEEQSGIPATDLGFSGDVWYELFLKACQLMQTSFKMGP
eukprot:TRINITY_DN43715_c0_g1_i1.p1 TRINITY_DN43715_c0_g1~~TRINITY_DN43715_c0_g1_i1.p1  ORF type:complete len:399 (+),score=27.36 TRINITY_DN43715_c0_g1_i1:3-1199(+)